jgi:multiple sugar transport system substrate-binding protein
MSLCWERQSLEGFEAHPIADLAERYDLIVLDHPHLGDAVAAECLVPLESLFAAEEIAAWAAASVGRSFASYHYAGKNWALPLDAATQVTAFRSELLQDEPPPTTWDAVIALAQRRSVCLSLAGPHAALTFMSICTALGGSAASKDPDQFVSSGVGTEALAIMAALYRRATRLALGKNPIGILEAMAQGADIAYCPLIYGYVNYAAAAADRHAVRFGDVPAVRAGGMLGSTLGGTGLAITRRTTITSELLAHLRHLMSEHTQCRLIPHHDGQPSARARWEDKEVNDPGAISIATRSEQPRRRGFGHVTRILSRSRRGRLHPSAPPWNLRRRLRRCWLSFNCNTPAAVAPTKESPSSLSRGARQMEHPF